MATMTTQDFQNFVQEMKTYLNRYITQNQITYEKRCKKTYHEYVTTTHTEDCVRCGEDETHFYMFVYVSQNKNVFSKMIKKLKNKNIDCCFYKQLKYDVNTKQHFSALQFLIQK